MKQHSRNKIIESKELFTIVDAFEIQRYEDRLVSEKNIKAQFYFDTSDIMSMILGLLSLNKSRDFDLERFDESIDTLVNALVQEERLGKICLLKPHLDELFYLVTNQESKFPSSQSNRLYTILKDDLIKKMRLNHLKELENENHNIQKISLDVTSLFKSKFLLKPLFWHRRLRTFFNTFINDNTSTVSYNELQKHPVYTVALEKLNEIRPLNKKTGSNNNIDALAIVHLQMKLEMYTKGKSKEIPLFYISPTSKNMKKVLHHIYKNTDYLSYKKPKSQEKIPVFRNSDFLILDAIFNTKHNTVTADNLNKLSELRGNIFLKITTEAKENLDDLKKNILTLIHIEFFDKIWYTESKLIKFINEELSEIINAQYTDSIQKEIQEEKKRINERFKEGIDDIKRLKSYFSKVKILDNLTLTIDNRFKKNRTEEEPFLKFRLFKFPFSEISKKIIEKDIVEIEEVVLRKDRNSLEMLFNSMIFELTFNLDKIESSKLNAYFAIFWIFDLYNLIIKVCEDYFLIKKSVDYNNKETITTVHVLIASYNLTKDPKNIEKAIVNLKKIEINHHTKDITLLTGNSFANFNIWYYYFQSMTLPELLTSDKWENIKQHRYYKYSLKAIRKIKKVYDSLRNQRINDRSNDRIYYYALNNIIYYTTKSSSVNDFLKIKSYYSELVNLIGDDYNWQHIFYDTLGWYCLRKSILSFKKGSNTFSDDLHQAEKYNSLALDSNFTDREEATYKKLTMAIENFESTI